MMFKLLLALGSMSAPPMLSTSAPQKKEKLEAQIGIYEAAELVRKMGSDILGIVERNLLKDATKNGNKLLGGGEERYSGLVQGIVEDVMKLELLRNSTEEDKAKIEDEVKKAVTDAAENNRPQAAEGGRGLLKGRRLPVITITTGFGLIFGAAAVAKISHAITNML